MRNGTKKKKRFKKLKENKITKRHKRDIEEKIGGKRYLAQEERSLQFVLRGSIALRDEYHFAMRWSI
jgi:hypothetical protein